MKSEEFMREHFSSFLELVKLPPPCNSSSDPFYFAGRTKDGWSLVAFYKWDVPSPSLTVGDEVHPDKGGVIKMLGDRYRDGPDSLNPFYGIGTGTIGADLWRS